MTSPSARLVGLGGIALAGILVIAATAIGAYRANGGFGFPLDDPWIHLQFARNLRDYGVFSYFQDQQVTSGSTSPLYTALLALGMLFTRHEFLLSYALGVVFLLASGWATFRLGRRLFEGVLFPLGAAALVVLDPRLVWSALSGMETTLFLALVLSTVLFYVERRSVALGICAGLALWARPEALLLIVILGVDQLVTQGLRPSRWFGRALAIAAMFVAGYGAFNLTLSGSFFPNTIAAKLKYYAGSGGGFALQLLSFLTGGPMLAVAPLAAVGVVHTVRRPTPMLVAVFWVVAMTLVYAWKMPYLYQNGRYLLPILPFVFLLAMSGLEVATRRVPHAVGALVVAAVVAWTLSAAWISRDEYATACRYIDDRQVATARWIHDHVPEDAVVATHDVGALAYYSERRIVDMVGLISPEVIDRIGHDDLLLDYLQGEGVTHLAVLRTWFAIANTRPLFTTDVMHPEVMEVFALPSDGLHVTDHTAALLTEQARMELAAGNVQLAGALLQRALLYDTKTARIHFLLGRALLRVGRPVEAQREFDAALRLQPDLRDEVASEMNR